MPEPTDATPAVRTTRDVTIVPGDPTGRGEERDYRTLVAGPREPHRSRTDLLGDCAQRVLGRPLSSLLRLSARAERPSGMASSLQEKAAASRV